MLRLVENISVLVVQVRVHGDLAAGQLGELLRSSERDDALLLPLIDSGDGSVGVKGSRYSSAPTKKVLGCLDKHALDTTACWN